MWSVAFSPDGQLAVGNEDGTVDLWNLSGSEPISRTLPGRHSDWAFSVAFDAEGKRLASAGKDGKIILWSELASSKPVSQTLRIIPPGSTTSPSARTAPFWRPVATMARSGFGTWRKILQQHRARRPFWSGLKAWDLAFSPDDGKLLAVGWAMAWCVCTTWRGQTLPPGSWLVTAGRYGTWPSILQHRNA